MATEKSVSISVYLWPVSFMVVCSTHVNSSANRTQITMISLISLIMQIRQVSVLFPFMMLRYVFSTKLSC